MDWTGSMCLLVGWLVAEGDGLVTPISPDTKSKIVLFEGISVSRE